MMSALLLTVCIHVCLLPGSAILTSDNGAMLTILSGSLSDTNYEVSPAQFGYESYKASITGLLVLPSNETYHTECPGQSSESPGTNPYIEYIHTWFGHPNDITDYMIIIDRGDCQFVDKVYHAQTMDASAVIICDTKNEALFDMNEDHMNNITIPSVLLQKSNCENIMNQLGVQNWDPLNHTAMIYPSASNILWTTVQIQWGLPRTDNKITLEFWTSSSDVTGAQFMNNFTQIAMALQQENSAVFTPYLHILDGAQWGCDNVGLSCKRQCSNNGRYCAVDPEYDLSVGFDGTDVVQENLRSMCVREYVMDNQLGYMLWWNYTTLWHTNCGIGTSTQNWTTCSFLQMDSLDATTTLSQFVTNCIASSGGYGYTNGNNTLFEAELVDFDVSLPMMKLNKFWFDSTSIHCPSPVTIQTCAILRAICQSFINGTQPAICSNSCDNSQLDCAGTCFGIFESNPCGLCIDSTRSDFNSFGKDCGAVCNGAKQIDECGACLSPTDSAWDSCVGCDNVAHSGKELNDCGLCITANDPNFNSLGKDCRGICASTPSDTYYVDLCGQCLLMADPEWNRCATQPTAISSTIMTTSNQTTSITAISTSSTVATDTSQTGNHCPMGCLSYFDGCDWCWCSGLGEFSTCSDTECNDTTMAEPYCDECHKEVHYCDDGTFVNRLLEKHCEFEQCIDILSNDAQYQHSLGAIFTIFHCVLIIIVI